MMKTTKKALNAIVRKFHFALVLCKQRNSTLDLKIAKNKKPHQILFQAHTMNEDDDP